ncbi:unnamed protein product [Caenorhabditis auriculariae]|uniref:CYtochrome P450 family n=1 Tax=Caenorhabditis auriculariae TaxID=2777116 RepID=A0A8S1HDL0_9PELO|nr:unnamed protein product [Caenorhabditis auriculariae]
MFLLIIITFLFAYIITKQWKSRMNLPKGPIPFPLIGNIPQVLLALRETGSVVGTLRKFQKDHGKIYTLWFGPMKTVHICDYDLAYEVMVKNGSKYAERFVPGSMRDLTEGCGVIWSNGEFWQRHRRFALHTLRNFGLGKNLMEERIMEEINARFAELDRKQENVRDAGRFFDILVGSIINNLIFSERFSEGDEEYEKLKGLLDKSFEGASFLDTFIPSALMNSPLLKFRKESQMGPMNKILAYLREKIDRRFDAIENGKHVIPEEPQDYVDAFLKQMEKEKKENGEDSTFNFHSLSMEIIDLWLAGQETSSTTLVWAVLLLLNNPEEIVKTREEIIKVTDNGTSHVSLADRTNTPYLNAVINEIQRHASILNINLGRINPEDTTIDGQPVEKGAMITAQLSLILSDEKDYPNSEQFLPSRFIENESLQQRLCVFGLGKRACLGESLARAELYLILGNLLLRYDLQPDGDLPPAASFNPIGAMNKPHKCSLKFIKL